MPKWISDVAGAVVFLFLVVFVVVLVLPADERERVAAAGEAVGAFGVIGAVAAAFFALRALDLQRISLDEQRRALTLTHYASLRAEYADLVGAAADVVVAILGDDASEELRRFHRAAVRVQLHDASRERLEIVGALQTAMEERSNTDVVARDIVHSVYQLLAVAIRHDKEVLRTLRTSTLMAEFLARRSGFEELIKKVKDSDIPRLRDDAVTMASLALRTSLAAESGPINPLPVPPTIADAGVRSES